MRRAAAVLLVALAPGCREPARALSSGPGGPAESRALVESLAARFGPARDDAAYEALRPKLARSALVPSRLFDDAEAWSQHQRDRRAVEIAGAGPPGAYRLAVSAGGTPMPSAPGAYRGRIELQRTGAGRFQWDVDEELAVGPVRVAALSAALGALARGAEATDGVAARGALARAFPRARPAFGRLLRLETLALWRDGGATTAILGVRLAPEGLRPGAPRLADFVSRYFGPMKGHAVAADASGRAWWTLDVHESLWTLRLRFRDGALVPLSGPAGARVPDELALTADYETRMGRFRIGVRRLVSAVTLVRTPAEKGFVVRFLQEPEWDLPFLVEPLLHGPLAQPFEAPGSEIGFSAREASHGGTHLVRRLRARVRESFVLRWLGGLTSAAMSDFRAGAEAELDAWTGECLLALRDDVEALAR
jgi:hypothetical protein